MHSYLGNVALTTATCCIFTASCVSTFQNASISRIAADGEIGNTNTQELTYRYRINGLQQMVVFLDPEKKLFQPRHKSVVFTQDELSKLRIKVTSLSGKLDVNGLMVSKGQTIEVDLTRIFNPDGKQGKVMKLGKYNHLIRFVSYKNVAADENLCDFMLTIEDPEGITRTTGLRVHGGFTDSL